jgi:hypothetical protein
MTTATAGRTIGTTLAIAALTILLWASWLVGLSIYVLSAVAAWQLVGGLAAFLTLGMPPLGQIYWLFESWSVGGPLTLYSLLCYAWAAIMLVLMLAAALKS